jgi:methionine synthase II (cobalamin-independent)
MATPLLWICITETDGCASFPLKEQSSQGVTLHFRSRKRLFAQRLTAKGFRRALPHVRAEQIVVAPDCGLKYRPRNVAFGKIYAMVQGAKIIRRELTGHNAT